MQLRLITKWDEEKQEEVQFLSNHLKLGATTIARIYKERWQIEIFFKSLKQLLRVKTFVGTSANALHVQIWTALDCDFDPQVPTDASTVRLVLVQSGSVTATAVVRLPRSVPLARLSI